MAINAYSWAKDGEKNLSPSFKVREFRCSDNTDPIFIDSELVEILQKIRNHFGKPVNITSGFRTASKNATIKNAAKFSQHLYGKAADIWISGVTVEQIAAYAETLLPKVTAMLDKLAKHNIIHKNKAGNLKSALQLHVNAL